MSILTGEVTDSNDNPVEGVVIEVALQISATDERTDVIRRETDADGQFDIELHPDADGTVKDWHIMARYEDDGEFNSVSEPRESADLDEGLTFFVRSTKGETVASSETLSGHTKVRQQPNSQFTSQANSQIVTIDR